MRIAILGDYHINADHLHYTTQAMEDIKGVSPDLVVPLGDFGSNEVIGSVEGLEQGHKYLSMIGAPIRPILGNHDLERESGVGVQPKGTIEQALRQLYHLEASHGVIELEYARLFFLSSQAIPEDDCYHIQECYTSDQYEWTQQKLRERPDVPVIVFSHAPPVGSGLRTVPQVHVRDTNAYLDQNHQPYKWVELYRNHPQIMMWFSAHYHLGHDYPDSDAERFGTHFFMTGVHGIATRDGKRQTRIIDLQPNEITVRTLDHEARALRSISDWHCNDVRQKIRDVADSADHDEIRVSPNEWTMSAAVPIGIHGSKLEDVIPIDKERCLVHNHPYLWEVDLHTITVMGTLQYAKQPFQVMGIERNNSNKYVWLASRTEHTRIDLQSLRRFVRHFHGEQEQLDHVTSELDLNHLSNRCSPSESQTIVNGFLQSKPEFSQIEVQLYGCKDDSNEQVYVILPAPDEKSQPILQVWRKGSRE